MALSRVTTWAANDVLTAAALNAEFDNILNNAASFFSPLTGSLSFGGFDATSVDEIHLSDASASASAIGRLRRNATNLTWHDGTGVYNLVYGDTASTTQMAADASATVYVTASRTRYYPGVAKVWVRFASDGTVGGHYNVTSITDSGVGSWTVTVATDFSAAVDTAYFVSARGNSGPVAPHGFVDNAGGIAAGSGTFLMVNAQGVLQDADTIQVLGFGAST